MKRMLMISNRLAFNDITSAGASVLFEWIRQNLDFLSKIILYGNELDDNCLPAMRSLLDANILDSLNLCQNHFSDELINMLYDVVREKKDTCKLLYFDVNPTTNITEKSYPAILDIIKLSHIEEFQVIFDQLQLNGEFYASLACNKLKNGSNVIDCDST